MASAECAAMRAKMSSYLDSGLDDAPLQKLTAHLKECADCTAFFNTLRMTLTLYQNLPPDKMAKEARERLLRNLHLDTMN